MSREQLAEALAPLVELAAAFVAAEDAADAEYARLGGGKSFDPFIALAVYAEPDELREKWSDVSTARELVETVRRFTER